MAPTNGELFSYKMDKSTTRELLIIYYGKNHSCFFIKLMDNERVLSFESLIYDHNRVDRLYPTP